MTAPAERPLRPRKPSRARLQVVPTPTEQAAFEDRLVDWLVRVNLGWIERQEAGR